MEHLVALLKPGMIISEDLYTENGELVLAVGSILAQQQIDKLMDLGIFLVKVYPNTHATNQNEPFVAPQSSTQKVYADTVQRFKNVFQGIRYGKQAAFEDIEEMVTPIVDEVLHNSSVARQLWQLEVCDAYTFDHSVAVSLASALLAKWLNFDEKTIKTIAVGGLMHDIGKVNIPDQILNKPSGLTPDEMKVMKTHATLGYVLLMNQKKVSEYVLKMVVEHHERYDGSGYPNGLVGDSIHPFSRIVAVADVFSAMTTKRVYREASNPFKVAKQMMDQSYGSLDPRLTQIFLSNISNYYVGNIVTLSSGALGEVVMINKTQPHRPLVQVGEVFIDLMQDYSLEIESIIF